MTPAGSAGTASAGYRIQPVPAPEPTPTPAPDDGKRKARREK